MRGIDPLSLVMPTDSLIPMNTRQPAEMLVPTEVKPLAGYRIWLRFSDGVEGEIDLSPLACAEPFQAWQDRAFFESVQICGNSIIWSPTLDFNAKSFYLELTGKTREEAFGPPMPTIDPVEVQALDGCWLWVRFSDGTEGKADLSPMLESDKCSLLADRAFFKSVHLTPWGGIAWSDDIEADEDWVYKEITGRTIDEAQKVLQNA